MTTVFTTRTEAERFAGKRREGFRRLKKGRSPTEQRYLDQAIKTVKVRRIKQKHWSNALYEVVGK